MTGKGAPRWLAPGLLVLLVVATFLPMLLRHEALFELDLRYLQWPYRQLASERFAEGELALWTPQVRGGFPLHAYGEVGLTYPPNWLLFLLPLPEQLALGTALHLALAALFLFLYARQLGLDPPAALVVAASFSCGCYVLDTVAWINAVAVLAWWPLLLYALDRLARDGCLRWVGLAGLAGALMLLAGRPHVALVAGPVGGLLALARIGSLERRSRLRAVGRLALAAGLALALAAPQWLPTWELLQRSARAQGLDPSRTSPRDNLQLSATGLGHLLLPPGLHTGPQTPRGHRAFQGFVALGLAGLALLGLLRRRSWLGLAGLALLVCGLGLAVGERSWLFQLVAALPGLGKLRRPVRYLLLFSFGLALLAGAGMQRVRRLRTRWLLALVALLELGIAARVALPFGPYEAFTAEPRLAGMLRELEWRDRDGWTQRFWAAGVPPLYADTLPADPDAAVDFVRDGELLGSSLAAFYGFREAIGYGDLAPRRWDALLRDGGPGVWAFVGVRYMVWPNAHPPEGLRPLRALPLGATLCELPEAGPRARILREVQVVAGETASLAAVVAPDFDASQTLVLERKPPAFPPAIGPAAEADRLLWTRDEPERLQLEVALTAPGFLVLADAWGPGWRCTVNGEPAPVLRAQHALRAIPLAAGQAVVELEYRPAPLRLGLAVAGAALLAVAAVALWRRRRG